MGKAYPILKYTLLPLAKFLFVKNIEGLENLPKKGPFILAMNHASVLDAVLAIAVVSPKLNKKLHFLMATYIFWWKLGGYPFWGLAEGSIPVGKNNKKTALEPALKLLRKGEIIGIMPEGTRSRTGELLEGRTGVARLALRSGAPVVPLGIKNNFEVWPKGKIPKFKKIIELKIGKPIYYKQKKMSYKVLRSITDDVMKRIGKLIGKRYSPKKS